MASDDAPRDRSAEWRSAGLKLGAAVVVLVALLVLYAREVRVETQVKDLLFGAAAAHGQRLGGARAALAKDSPAGWLQAEAALLQAIQHQPSNPYALAALAYCQQLLAADGVERRSQAEQAVLRAEAKDVNRPERHAARALSLIAAGRADEAATALRPLVERFPGEWELWDALGLSQRAAGNLDDAKKSLRRAMEIGWRTPRAGADYARLLLEEGSAVEAGLAYDRSLQANADHVRSQIGKARALLAMAAQGKTVDLKAARKWVDDVLARPAGDLSPAIRAAALGARAEALLAQGDAAAALKEAEDALAAQPGNAPGLRARALAMAAIPAQKAGALAAMKEAIAKDRYDVSLYFDGSAALAQAGEPVQAEKLLGSYAALLPKTARYQLALARLQISKDDLKGAAVALKAAADAEPTNASVYFEQGRLSQRQGDFTGARKAYEKALALRDDYPEVYRQMGALYLDGKDVDQAVVVYVEALRRYKAARVPEPQLEPFYREVADRLTRANQEKRAEQWLKDARAMH
jgi:tetratricopeptide (TPR) repeat protein